MIKFITISLCVSSIIKIELKRFKFFAYYFNVVIVFNELNIENIVQNLPKNALVDYNSLLFSEQSHFNL